MTLSKEEMEAPHPDLNAIAAFADGRLPDVARSAIAEHLAVCLECRTILATQARGQIPQGVDAGERAGLGSPARFRPAVWLPIAATLALATTTAVLVWRVDRTPGGGEKTVPASPPAVPSPTGQTPAAPLVPRGDVPTQPSTSPPAAVAPAPPAPEDPLATRRGGVRTVNGKTFRLVAGEWIDAAYDPVDLFTVREIAGADARAALLDRVPALAPYAAIGPTVIVVHDGVVYKFRQ